MRIFSRDPDGSDPKVIVPDARNGYLSCEWTEWLWKPDVLTVKMDARVARKVGATKGRLLVLEEADLCFFVTHVQVEAEGRRAHEATVHAVERWASARRRVHPAAGLATDDQTGPAETVMKHYVDVNCGPNAVDAYGSGDRSLPHLAIGADQGRGPTTTQQARHEWLHELLAKIGMETGVGFRTVWDPTRMMSGAAVFDTVHGRNRTADTILSLRLGTVSAERIVDGDPDRVSHVLVGGDGEGVDRTIVSRWITGTEPSGDERHEDFVDARTADDTAALESEGDAHLWETAADTIAEATLNESSLRYRDGFDLGDLLTFRSDWIGDRGVRVVGVTSQIDQTLTPLRTVHLDRPWPTRDRVTLPATALS